MNKPPIIYQFTIALDKANNNPEDSSVMKIYNKYKDIDDFKDRVKSVLMIRGIEYSYEK